MRGIDLRRQVAVVTGASSGIGRALALALADAQAVLQLVGRDRARLEAVADQARGRGAEVEWAACDLAEPAQVGAFARRLGNRDIGILIHSAGLYERGPHEEREAGAYRRLFTANVEGPMQLTQALLPALRRARGQIVFINSTQGLNPAAGVGLFAATQHALKAMADTLRDEVNPDGIRVLTVHPGRTATPRQEAIFAAEGRTYRPERLLQPEDIAEIVLAALRLPRTAEVTNLTIRPMLKS